MRDGARDEQELARRLLDAWRAGEPAGEDMTHVLRSTAGSARIFGAAASPTLFATLRAERLARCDPDRCTPELPALEVEEMIMQTLQAIAGREPMLRSWN
jgi:hypothetical protein